MRALPSLKDGAQERVGILLAGGSGTRLRPVTAGVNKQLLPIYDRPMIYFPLSLLLAAGMRKIVIVTTPDDVGAFRRLLGSGQQWGVQLHYAIQHEPRGLAHALLVAEPFLDGHACCLALGDNVFQAPGLPQVLRRVSDRIDGATIFGIEVPDPTAFGVAECDDAGNVLSLEEKPAHPRSNLAVPGIYFFDRHACDLASSLEPSARGEFEITDLNRLYLERGALRLQRLAGDVEWLDAGTLDDLVEAGRRVREVERTTATPLGSPDLAVFRNGWIDARELAELARLMPGSAYGQRLLDVAAKERSA